MQMIVQCSRYHDGGRRTSHISEILGVDEKEDIFHAIFFAGFKQVPTQKLIDMWVMVPCNYVPSFFDEIVVNKLPFPKSMFIALEWATKRLKQAA